MLLGCRWQRIGLSQKVRLRGNKKSRKLVELFAPLSLSLLCLSALSLLPWAGLFKTRLKLVLGLCTQKLYVTTAVEYG